MMDYLQPCPHLQCKTGWTKCLLYQKGIDEELSCTTEAKPIITGAGGKTLADTLLGFCKIDYLPRRTILAFSQDICPACEQATNDDAIRLARAAYTVRPDMFRMTTAFTGSFDISCKYQSTAKLYLCVPTTTLAISQLLMFIFSAHRRE